MNFNPIFTSKHGILHVVVLLSLLFTGLQFSSAQTSPDRERFDPYAANTSFSPSMAIIIARRRLPALPESRRGPRPRQRRHRDVPDTGLLRGQVLKIGKGALECAVCLCEFEDDETLRLIPKCDHVFHPECIDAWLSSHTTCPVCRSNLSPQPGESVPQLGDPESPLHELDVEAQNGDVVESEHPDNNNGETQAQPPEPQVIDVMNPTLNRNRTRGSRSNQPRKFPRSHSTGHSLIQPGENTERFTLRLPVDVRKQVMNRKLNRANSLVVLPMESSSRRGYRTGGEGSSRGKNSRRLERMDRSFKSDRWVFSKAPPFFSRAYSLRSPKVAASNSNEPPTQAAGPEGSLGEPGRPPV
ncbi:hypothetical protein JRO89_XS04G0188700 [Xanthoceras sorbifolium]|uniref:RING-type E3 ubiquitin transferase n=1 Tax=Xanthoceras sorbifolium TaxID=99658 RepID=A0ABQ8I5Z5_9ROSI|nr:hypothetical protein JRO89_XS04G0188700 [Xanthoceras sorbifolium]